MNNEGVDIMLESFNVNNEMQYQKLSLDEQQKRGILGRLVGVIADFNAAELMIRGLVNC